MRPTRSGLGVGTRGAAGSRENVRPEDGWPRCPGAAGEGASGQTFPSQRCSARTLGIALARSHQGRRQRCPLSAARLTLASSRGCASRL